MNIYTIYKCTNTINNKTYIGFDSSWPKRKQRHLRMAKNECGFKFHNAIRKYGASNFKWSVIYQSSEQDHTLNVMEQHFIEEYDSINKGYNLCEGGAGVIGVVKDTMWINNGTEHKRIPFDSFIPDGWVKGRINLKRKVGMSRSSKKKIGSKNRQHMLKKHKCPYCDMETNKQNLIVHIRTRH